MWADLDVLARKKFRQGWPSQWEVPRVGQSRYLWTLELVIVDLQRPPRGAGWVLRGQEYLSLWAGLLQTMQNCEDWHKKGGATVCQGSDNNKVFNNNKKLYNLSIFFFPCHNTKSLCILIWKFYLFILWSYFNLIEHL
jgi:hypothetical protein